LLAKHVCWALLTYAVTYSTTSCFFGFVFFTGVIILGGMDITFFQGSRGGNDTRLHCLGTVEIPGFVFFVFIAGLHISFYLGSCISVWGWVIRDTHCFLASGWLG